ncbi:prepilin-type N-terminal cleavage/methylation domain-containing protein [Nitrospira sp. M1]
MVFQFFHERQATSNGFTLIEMLGVLAVVAHRRHDRSI